jgi:hypothetical protein
MAGGPGKLRAEDNPKPFKKGECFPKQGHPKGVPNSKTRLRRLLELVQDKKNPVTGEIEKFSVIEQMDMALISKALKGDINAYKEVLDRLEGKATQTQEISVKKIEDIEPIKWTEGEDKQPL